MPLLLLLALFLDAVVRSSSILSVQDVQFHIWCHLTRQERLLFRVVSTSCHRMHLHLFPAECTAIMQCKHLSHCIQAMDPNELISFFASKQRLRYIDPAALYHDPVERHGLMLMEKIMVEIAERATSFDDASRACVLWLNSCIERSVGFDGLDLQQIHEWPTVDDNGSVTSSQWNMAKLHEMFIMAKIEMDRTKSKYNRYTRFAFVLLDSMLQHQNTTDPYSKNADQSVIYVLRHLWHNVVSVEFISDYLSRPLLRDFGEPCSSAIELIMDDAVTINDSLNTDRLMLMVHHPRILFKFDTVFLKMAEYEVWSDKTRGEFLEFIVNHGLITWPMISGHLIKFRAMSMIWDSNPMAEWMWLYVSARERNEYFVQRDSLDVPLLFTNNAVNQSIGIFKAWSKRNVCCLCM